MKLSYIASSGRCMDTVPLVSGQSPLKPLKRNDDFELLFLNKLEERCSKFLILIGAWGFPQQVFWQKRRGVRTYALLAKMVSG